ncbi:predicted protein [Lichtheimia corymbifera JMRC:FSU:9682]|uniref:Uncharacterized protein n=1 Tax=Lichtheimia corymbifera JMRC:FSU:9682 TaxID=1263082 RepID=A0A068REK5_9FUNG|nr:predicted protein [Lichtheimia corymbifera JMRC:FSU:9682]
MQQLFVMLAPAPTNYITIIIITGEDIKSKMAALKQYIGKLARPVVSEKLHFLHLPTSTVIFKSSEWYLVTVIAQLCPSALW